EVVSPGDVQLFYQTALLGRRDLHLAPDPKSGVEMTLLRMLAFRPAGAATAPAGGSGTAQKRIEASQPAAARRGKQVAAAPWRDPDWKALLPELALSGAVKLLAGNCAYLKREANTLHLKVDPRSQSLLTKQRKDALAEALSSHFSEPLTIDISVGQTVKETPLQQESRLADERIEAAKVKLESDPNVQTLKDMFGAELKPETIELINPSQND
ncbi:MAG: DNA polymerase III subunit gamma/tau, partial [Gammaproteobacteria bacterium]|nr:DNA polymerase III subunit gamma/tau [Gammaproteobacteria bacterium]